MAHSILGVGLLDAMQKPMFSYRIYRITSGIVKKFKIMCLMEESHVKISCLDL